MPSSQPVADLLADLARGLGALGVRWFLFGAQAAILHGAARLSADVDVTVDLGTRSSRELVDALAREGFELRVADAEGGDLDVDAIRGTLRLLERALGRADLVSELDRVIAGVSGGPRR